MKNNMRTKCTSFIFGLFLRNPFKETGKCLIARHRAEDLVRIP